MLVRHLNRTIGSSSKSLAENELAIKSHPIAAKGIEVRHRTTCASRAGDKCNCKPAYQASVWSAREGKRLRKTFPTLPAARAWRAEAQTAVRRGTLRAPIATTVREAGDALVDGMRSGSVRTRSGDRYKPSAFRSYDAALRDRIVPALGGKRLGDVQRRDVQRLATSSSRRDATRRRSGTR
jgi:hypothetical protein